MDAALDKADNMMDAARNVAIAHFRKSAGQYVFSETIRVAYNNLKNGSAVYMATPWRAPRNTGKTEKRARENNKEGKGSGSQGQEEAKNAPSEKACLCFYYLANDGTSCQGTGLDGTSCQGIGLDGTSCQGIGPDGTSQLQRNSPGN